MTHCATGHTWTPLYPGWEPDLTTACDCEGTTFGEEQRRLMAERLAGLGELHAGEASKWDIARAGCRCQHCPAEIGAGEPVRLVTAARWKYCTCCAATQFGEAPPDHLPVRRIADDLPVPAGVTPEMPAARVEVGMARFDKRAVARELKARILDRRAGKRVPKAVEDMRALCDMRLPAGDRD